MLTPSGHLTYCTNIHAGENWEDHFNAIKTNFPGIKKEISPNASMGIGLRLSNEASLDLIKKEKLELFKQWLKENDAYVFTMNGFPYGGFHHTRVKENVHSPDWTTADRTAYTLRLFQILKELLPEKMDGGISTSPITYRHWFKTADAFAEARRSGTANIITIAENLIDIERATGKRLHLDIEPEPDGMLETGAEFIEWYINDLIPEGSKRIASRFSLSVSEAEALLKRHITLCYDVCHFAIGYEPHEKVIRELELAGIAVGKIQISAALKSVMNREGVSRAAIRDSFARFNEPTYLHQVVARTTEGPLIRFPDLPEALAADDNLLTEEWRAHFHVPVSVPDFGVLQSTQSDILTVLALQHNKLFTNHLEVETYTWGVLPSALKLPLQESIIKELQWVSQNL